VVGGAAGGMKTGGVRGNRMNRFFNRGAIVSNLSPQLYEKAQNDYLNTSLWHKKCEVEINFIFFYEAELVKLECLTSD
jgi:hypothetical protein